MAATIYEPLSTAHLKSCTVDFDSRPDKKAVNLVQYDQTIPVLCVSLKKGGTEYKVPSDADVNIRMDKRDGYHVYNPALGVNAERTIAYFAVTPQMSTGWGDYYPIVEITVGGGIAGSAPIWLHFDRNPLPENAIISSDEYKTIQQLLKDVTAVKADTEQIKAQTEAVRDQAKGFADNAKNSADKAQTLVDGMPSDYSQAMKDIGTLKNQMQRAYPDDSTIGENTWSSKHIIDMLFPPLEESGNPVVCYPVAGYPLGVKAKWKPVQEGKGDPSPENIRPITGRDAVSVTRHGKNYVGDSHVIKSGVYSGVSYTINDDKTITMSGTPANNVLFMIISYEVGKRRKIYPGTYTLSGGLTNAALVFVAYDGNKANSQMIVNKKLTTTGETATFTIDAMSYFGLYAYAYLGQRVDGVMKPQIELSSTATPYEPYTGQTNTLTLPETVYGGEVDAVSGEWQETWKTITLDGKTNKFTIVYTFWNLPRGSAVGIGDWYLGNIYSSHFYNAFGGNAELNCLYTTPDIMTRYFQNIDALNDYIAAQNAAGTPVQITYKLKKPTPFTATGAQLIPALAGANTILTDADSATVTGRADPIKRITDLEDAVASQT